MPETIPPSSLHHPHEGKEKVESDCSEKAWDQEDCSRPKHVGGRTKKTGKDGHSARPSFGKSGHLSLGETGEPERH